MTYSSEVLADSPLVYWRLGESSGSSAADSSGNSRAGTYVGTPTFGVAGGVSGDTAVDVDGTAWVESADAAWQRPTSFTAEALVRPDATAFNAIVAKDGSAVGWAWYVTSGVLRLYANGNPVSGAVTISTGVWTHVAVTYDAATSTAKLYVNGTLDSTFTSVSITQTTTAPLMAGVSTGGGGGAGRYFSWDGRLDEVAYYGTVLSGTRIAAHHAAISASPPVDLSGAVAATSGSQGSLLANRLFSGTVAATSGTSGAISAPGTFSGTVAAISAVSGALLELDGGFGFAEEIPDPVIPPLAAARLKSIHTLVTSVPEPVLVDGRPT